MTSSELLEAFVDRYEDLFDRLLKASEMAIECRQFDESTNALTAAAGIATAMYAQAFQEMERAAKSPHRDRTRPLEDDGDPGSGLD